MHKLSRGKMCLVRQAALTALICAAAVAASAQSAPADQTKAPETAPVKPEVKTPTLGPSGREIKFAEYTWIRFGFQIQAWFKAAQDRIVQPDKSDGGYAMDFYCRRCRIFAGGSLVKDVNYFILFEATPGKADAITGVKASPVPSVLDAFANVKFADAFQVTGGSILLPLTRNGMQPTTTYLSIDNANVDVTPILQGNSNVIRDLGLQFNGFFLENHLEYRLGAFQGSRQASTATQTAGHNAPRFVAMLSYNLWDTETGYVNGGHYYGTKKVLGVMANFDYQAFRKSEPPAAGTDKNPYKGFSAAAFINYPLSGAGNPKGGDELAGLLQWGYYDGGFTTSAAGVPTNPGTYPNVLKQMNYLAEGAYYNRDLKFSIFGKYEMRKISGDYPTALAATSNVTWIAGGLKYYVAPANLMNFALQYERIQFPDAPATAQGGTHNVTAQMQLLLY